MRHFFILGLTLALAACDSSGEFAENGQVRPLGKEVLSAITDGDLTDPDAYFEQLDATLSEAAAQQFGADDYAARSKFLKDALATEISSTFLMPISCSDDEGQPYLRFEKNTSTLVVNIARITPSLRDEMFNMADRIDAYLRELNESSSQSVYGPDVSRIDFADEHDSELKSLNPKAAIAGSWIFGEDRIVAISNSPFAYVTMTVRLGAADVGLSIAEARFADLKGEDIDPLETQELELASRILRDAAAGRAPPEWYRRVTYAGEQPVCLLGQFSFIDPVPGGTSAYVFHPNDAGYSTELYAWYLVERETLSIVTVQELNAE